MRIIPFIISVVLTAALIFALNNKWGGIPPLGKFLSPQQGFWQNAEATDHSFNEKLTFKALKGKVNVYIDDRLVPHVFAEQESDAYFVQGYLHAKFRLWQMEFQTMAAAGRIAEILGGDERFIRYDREQRRLGMVYGAENAVKGMEADPQSKMAADAYTAGVNAYINSLTESSLPIEYKLLDYKPEQWSNFKIGLFLKQMSKDLAGYERDLEFTNAKAVLSAKDLSLLYPQFSDSTVPIIPAGTLFAPPGIVPVKPATADSLYFNWDTTVNAIEVNKPNRLNGSNNWAVSGQKTASGAPILSNDPHLGLSLPSIWYEMQLSTPTMNAYGATFPGSPSVIIGFNDSIAFGFTNAMRDVKDYYAIRFKDATKREYWFDSTWHPTDIRVEQIKVRGGTTILDTVAYTVFGPVIFDDSFVKEGTENKALAVRWTAHDVSNEGLMWVKLNRAKNYNDYLAAIKDFQTPGQNMLFASKGGDIALWQQAKFPAQWEGQGQYIMPGEDSSYMWQGYIPQGENPHIVNPASGFIQSANQKPVDSAYPYFMSGNFAATRGVTIHNQLQQLQGITPEHMMQLQNLNYDGFAADALPLMLKYTDATHLNDKGKGFLNILRQWDYVASADAIEPTIFRAWWDSLESNLLGDEMATIKGRKVFPDEQTVLELLLRDSANKFVNNINTTEVETLQQQVTDAFQKATARLQQMEGDNGLLWWKQKNTTVYHLLRDAVMPFARAGLHNGGWKTAPNAISHDHGPSWRMVVHLTTPTEAYGIYPGGQSGNPGSRFYDSFVEDWASGKYYNLWLMKEEERGDKRIRWTLQFTHA